MSPETAAAVGLRAKRQSVEEVLLVSVHHHLHHLSPTLHILFLPIPPPLPRRALRIITPLIDRLGRPLRTSCKTPTRRAGRRLRAHGKQAPTRDVLPHQTLGPGTKFLSGPIMILPAVRLTINYYKSRFTSVLLIIIMYFLLSNIFFFYNNII